MGKLALFTLILITYTSIFAKQELVPPVVIESSPDVLETTRSVNWPVKVEKPLANINLPQVDDSLNSLNGLQARTQGSPTISVRGSGQSGRSLVLYNHIPLNFATGFGVPNIFFAKENITKAIVVKGPASLFYGSQAMSGAIDFIPEKLKTNVFNFNLSDTNESFLPWRDGGPAHYSFHLGNILTKTKRSHIQSSLFFEDDDGYFPYQTADSSGIRDYNDQQTKRATLSGHTAYSWGTLDFDFLIAQQELNSPGSVQRPVLTNQDTRGGFASISPNIFLSDSLSWRIRLSQLESKSDFIENQVVSYTNQTTQIIQNEWVFDFNQRTKLQFFGDLFFHEMDNSFVGDNLKQENIEFGPFLSFYSLQNLSHQIGLRYLKTQDKALPIASTHLLWSKADLWVSFSEGFRNPTLSDLFAQSPMFIGNPDLVPETSKQYEVGVKNREFSRIDTLTWEVRAFHIEYQNFIESFEPTPSVFSRQNGGQGFARGVDLSLGKSFRKFHLNAEYNYLETKNKTADRAFRLSPKHQLTTTLTYRSSPNTTIQIQNTEWREFIDLNFNQPVRLDDWNQWNFFIHKNFNQRNTLSLGLINAFNESKELTFGYPEPQRKYWLRFRRTF